MVIEKLDVSVFKSFFKILQFNVIKQAIKVFTIYMNNLKIFGFIKMSL